ncbi:MAG TPA: hypothetical protein ENH98_01845 [archaeon]|nr:hypothetical protein [archaeon]
MSNNLRNHFWQLIYEKYENIIEKINRISDSMDEVGEDNEESVIKLIRDFLPLKYKVEQRKRILSKLGKPSSQHDIIIWNQNKHPPIFSENLKTNFRYFLIEMVGACIEVKTTLNKKKLEEAMKKIRDFRRDMLDGIHATYFYGPKRGYHEPLYCIFALDTKWKKFSTIIRNIENLIKINDIKPHERFDYLFILKKGIIVQWAIPELLNNPEEEQVNPDSVHASRNIFYFPFFRLNITGGNAEEELPKEAPIIMPYDKTQLYRAPAMKQFIQFFSINANK